MRNKIEHFLLWKWLLSIERFIMIFSNIAVVLTISAIVVCRYFLKINFAGSDEILVIFALWLYYSGGLYGSYEDCHIKADMLSIFVGNDIVLRITNILVKFISLIVSIWLAIWACQYLDLCLQLGGSTLVYHLPMLCSRGALVVGYIAPVLYNIYHFILALVEKTSATSKFSGDQMDEHPETSETGGSNV